MKMPYYSAGKMRDYGGEKSHVIAEMNTYFYGEILDSKY
jgi:hypothetical protein